MENSLCIEGRSDTEACAGRSLHHVKGAGLRAWQVRVITRHYDYAVDEKDECGGAATNGKRTRTARDCLL